MHSFSPRSRSRSSTRRRSRWLGVSRPTAARRAGSVVGSLSRPWMRATSSIRSASRWTSLSRHGGDLQPPVSLPRSRAARGFRRLSPHRPARQAISRSAQAGTERRAAAKAAGTRRPCPGTSRAPHRSTIRRAASRWAAIACSGCSCFSKRADASLRSPSAFELRMMFGPDPGGRLHQDARRLVGDLGDLAAHDPRDAARPLGVADQGHLGGEDTLGAVEGDHALAVAGPAHDDAPAAHLVEVERVQRLGGIQHHVVGDVDHVGDRPLPGRHQPLLEPQRRRPDLDVLEHARREAQADLGVDLDRDVVLGGVVAARLGVGRRWDPGRAPRP